jgi:hypothetical protein
MFSSRRFLLVILLFLNIVANAQSTGHIIQLFPKFGTEELKANGHFFKWSGKDSIAISELKFYISSVQLIDEKDEVISEENSYHLIDFSDSSTMRIVLRDKLEKLKKLKFKIGIDSLTNVSGAHGGQLDPTLGMYWTWQSGYINLKLEGISNLCKTRKNEFTFHLGGYQGAESTIQDVVIDCSELPIGEKINLDLDVKKFLSTIDLTTLNHIMSPGQEAVRLSNRLPEIFSLQRK